MNKVKQNKSIGVALKGMKDSTAKMKNYQIYYFTTENDIVICLEFFGTMDDCYTIAIEHQNILEKVEYFIVIEELKNGNHKAVLMNTDKYKEAFFWDYIERFNENNRTNVKVSKKINIKK